MPNPYFNDPEDFMMYDEPAGPYRVFRTKGAYCKLDGEHWQRIWWARPYVKGPEGRLP